MSALKIVMIGVFFLLLAWGGSAGIAYAVIELTGRADPIQGVQGEPGPQGERGPQGAAGSDAAQAMVKRLAALWAVQAVSNASGGAFVSFTNTQVTDCVDYILNGAGGFQTCPGFTR